MTKLFANRGDPDQMQQNDLGLYRLPIILCGGGVGCRLKLVKDLQMPPNLHKTSIYELPRVGHNHGTHLSQNTGWNGLN